MDKKPYVSWEEVKASLNINDEQGVEIRLEEEIIEATIEEKM